MRHQGAITTEIAREALELLEVDGTVSSATDRALLRAIVEKFDGGPVGLSTLAVALGEEPDTIEDVYEPYLLQLGFIQRTPRGRIVTKLGREPRRCARQSWTTSGSSSRLEFDRYTIALLILRPDAPQLDEEAAAALQDAHLAHLADFLHEAGHLLAAGPFGREVPGSPRS